MSNRTPPPPPFNALHLSLSLVLSEMLAWPIVPPGGSLSISVRCYGNGQQWQDVDAMGVDIGGAIATGDGGDSAIDGGMAA